MTEASIQDLQKAILSLHGCESRFVESVMVTERFQGTQIWRGLVSVFELIGHPASQRCYAWSHDGDPTRPPRCVAFLHAGTVTSPDTAVRAAMIEDLRNRLR